MSKVRIVSAITSKDGVTLYTSEGKEINLPATGWRTKSIMDDIVYPLAQHKTVEIELDNYSLESKIEKQSGGFIRFVKRKFKDFAAHFNLGNSDNKQERGYVAPAVNPEAETTVAVVNGVEIPGIEKLEKQLEYAAFQNSKGLEKFLERLAKVIDKRKHSVQELLNFMERGDLPIADDGSIVAYKILKYRNKGSDLFHDCHSQNVPQRVGSRVSMAEKMVDDSRRVQCSTGLHVARRGYIRGFGGDLVTLIKVAPEDVIAVPYNEPDKMRAAAYHIVAKLPDAAYSLLMGNSPMTSHAPSAQILANVIAGDHIGVIEEVVIGGPKGTDLRITPNVEVVGGSLPKVAEVKKDAKPVAALDDKKPEETVSVKEVKKVVAEAVAERKAKKSSKKKPVKKAAKAAASTPKAKTDPTEIPEKYREAYTRIKAGEISQRQAEKLYGVCGKKLRALRRAREGK